MNGRALKGLVRTREAQSEEELPRHVVGLDRLSRRHTPAHFNLGAKSHSRFGRMVKSSFTYTHTDREREREHAPKARIWGTHIKHIVLTQGGPLWSVNPVIPQGGLGSQMKISNVLAVVDEVHKHVRRVLWQAHHELGLTLVELNQSRMAVKKKCRKICRKK